MCIGVDYRSARASLNSELFLHGMSKLEAGSTIYPGTAIEFKVSSNNNVVELSFIIVVI